MDAEGIHGCRRPVTVVTDRDSRYRANFSATAAKDHLRDTAWRASRWLEAWNDRTIEAPPSPR